MNLTKEFTSTGEKLYWHQEVMQKLRNKKGQPIISHLMVTDVCNHRCAFCSVGERPGDVLSFPHIQQYLAQLVPLGLKAVIISGGGNPILYKCKETGTDFNRLVDYTHGLGLEIGLITNGMPMMDWYSNGYGYVRSDKWHDEDLGTRKSWKTVSPETLDKLTWCRISMAGLDSNHPEKCVYVPDFDRSKTSLGFSWIMSDAYEEPTHKHGWVSRPEDVVTNNPQRAAVFAEDNFLFIEEKIKEYVATCAPDYVRLLCNCLEPAKIPLRHHMLTEMANRIDPTRVFSQNKPPRQPQACYKGYPHPVLNTDGFVYPCDSVVLNEAAGHKFAHTWRICRFDEIGEFYAQPIRKNVPNTVCPGCVFSDQVDMIAAVVRGGATPAPTGPAPKHINFV